MSGDGSAAHPWSTFAEVVDPANKLISTFGHSQQYVNGTDATLYAQNPNAPIKAGDLILLASGNHGNPQILNMFNSDFITVAAAPGATPIVGPMKIVSASRWMFQGLTFEGMATTATGAQSVQLSSGKLVSVGDSDWIGQSSQIIFDTDTYRTAAAATGWSQYDWYDKPLAVALSVRTPCTSVTGSHLYNLLNGIFVDGPQTLIQGNTIEYFSNDGVEVAGSSVLIKGNVIRRGTNTTVSTLHPDGIQGWSRISGGVPVTNTQVVIDGNLISRTGDAALGIMQGISVFDGKWDGLVVQNNVVNVNIWHGIAIYGASNSRVLNNTVIAADPIGHASWILIHDGKDGTKSTAVVRNNIATSFVVQSPGTTLDHNIAAKSFSLPAGSSVFGATSLPTVNATPGGGTTTTSGTTNWVLPQVLNGFVTPNVADGSFNGRIKATSVAVGVGTLSGAPPLDAAGVARTQPPDLGAFMH